MTEPADVPKSIRRGPPITLTCDCGERKQVRYGERWPCEKCGKIWNTKRIPLEQYAAIRATQIKYRRIPVAIATLSLICIIVGIVLGKAFGGLIIIAVIATTWNIFFRPLHRRKYREALAQLPTWKIKPE